MSSAATADFAVCSVCKERLNLEAFEPWQDKALADADEGIVAALKGWCDAFKASENLVCGKCHTEAKAHAVRGGVLADLDRLKLEWDQFCKNPIYHDMKLSALPDRVAYDRAMAYPLFVPPPTKGNIILQGPTGLYKTGTSYQIAKHWWTTKRILFIRHVDFADQVTYFMTTDHGKSKGDRQKWIFHYKTCDLWIFDDLGKGRLGRYGQTVAEEAFLQILDARLEHRRPTVITTNLTGATLAPYLSDNMRDPILRRLREHFQVVRYQLRKGSRVPSKFLGDKDQMPWGENRGCLMELIPAHYYHSLWFNRGFRDRPQGACPVADYIRRSIPAFRVENKNLIWGR